MSSMSRFQMVFTGILVLLGVGGAILFATAKGKGGSQTVSVVMWGAVETSELANFLSFLSTGSKGVEISYVEKDPATIEDELISALARRSGPDMVLLPQDLIVKQLDKFYVVPFESYSARTFKDTFIREGELFMIPEGIIGLPFMIDPMVMYWNRDILTNAGQALPPATWTDLVAIAPKVTRKDANNNITQSLAAFGEVRNVSHAKDVISLLAMQAGTPIVERASNGSLVSVLDRKGTGLPPAEQAVSFYTEFSNPVKPSYSWNRSMPKDKDAFTAGRLAVYFGYASEVEEIREANPNLDFDVALVPQAGDKRLTFGKMHAIALLKDSPKAASAWQGALLLASPDVQKSWVEQSGLPPVRRDMLAPLPGDSYKSVFYQSALISSAWLDPYRESTDGVFMRLVENVTSGRLRVSESVQTASIEIDNLLRGNK